MRAKLLLIPVILILGIATAGFVFTHDTTVRQQHCVAEVQSISGEVNPLTTPSPMQCFDTPAEAVEFATGGAVKPDKSATSEEISQLLREYYDSLEQQ